MSNMSKHEAEIKAFMDRVKVKYSHEPEFIQAVEEIAESVIPFIANHPKYIKAKILDRMVEPERSIIFRVPWLDDKGEIQINTGYRVQFNSAIGPYKGGLRFHPSVNLSILKFLGFEQTFKNALTTLPMGGGKGGSDFDPRGKSDNEVMKFCQSFMTELYRHIGENTDVPAGDIGVGAREIGYLFGQYKRLTSDFTGVLTGKGFNWGGSRLRPEATGYGAVYFLQSMLATKGKDIKGKTIAVSGFGNVAWGVAKKAAELGGKVVTLSGPDGYIYDKDGVSGEKIEYMLELRALNADMIKPYAEKYKVPYFPNKRPWEQKVDIAMPCATQNELDGVSAQQLLDNGVQCIVEVANMPSTPEAYRLIIKSKILYSPGKASNAGGVATSCLEMSQNALHGNWSAKKVDERLKSIMVSIHKECVKYGKEGDYIDYFKGANIAGFVKVADSMIDQGIV